MNALDDPRYPTELGASIFIEENHILYNAAQEFGLDTGALRTLSEQGYSLGIWDGREFVFQQENRNGKSSWWDIAKLLWRYGLAPIRTQRLVKSTLHRFDKMYYKPLFPFHGIDEAAARVGLLDLTAATGVQTLKKANIGDEFAREFIQASTRVNYGQNLAQIHGLEMVVSMAPDGAMAVEGGNWQIFENMVKKSGAEVRLETTVTDVSRTKDGFYTIAAMPSPEDNIQGSIGREELFDTVILSAPYQFANVTFYPPLPPSHTPDKIPYVTLHVTLFTSPHRISPGFFKLPSSQTTPDMILTTLPPDFDPPASSRGKYGVGPPGFWSISLQKTLHTGGELGTQYLYKVFSPERLTASWLSMLLDVEAPQSMGDVGEDPISRVPKSDLSWFYEKKWHSYPYEIPRISFELIRLSDLGNLSKTGRKSEGELGGRGIWYTSGIESFISTMETSALMGKNVARLIVDELLAHSSEAPDKDTGDDSLGAGCVGQGLENVVVGWVGQAKIADLINEAKTLVADFLNF